MSLPWPLCYNVHRIINLNLRLPFSMCLNVRVISVPMRRIEHHNLEVPTRQPMPGPRLKIKSNVVYIRCLKTKEDFFF